MHIISIADTPFWEISYLTARPQGAIQVASLPLLHGTVDALPVGIAGLIACADLQGRELPGYEDRTPRLLGEVLVDDLAFLAQANQIPVLSDMGVLLAGDLYADPEIPTRGQSGNVEAVWQAFARHCRWVVGVAGNHDEFYSDSIESLSTAHLLDGNTVRVNGLCIGGVSGVIGNPNKGRRCRQSEEDLVRQVRTVLRTGLDILLLHQGPEIKEAGCLGHPAIRKELEVMPYPLTICGHVHWAHPLVTLPQTGQILNVDGRVVILRRG